MERLSFSRDPGNKHIIRNLGTYLGTIPNNFLPILADDRRQLALSPIEGVNETHWVSRIHVREKKKGYDSVPLDIST